MIITEKSQLGLEDLNSNVPSVLLEAVRRIKNSVIGSNRFKSLVLEQGTAERLVALMSIENGDIAREAMMLVNSLAKGTENHLRMLIEANAVPVLLRNTQSDRVEFTECSLRCLRTIFKSRLAPIDTIFQGLPQMFAKQPKSCSNDLRNASSSSSSNSVTMILPHLMSLAADANSSYITKECVANILAASCKTNLQQEVMRNLSAVELVERFLSPQAGNPYLVKLAGLYWLAQLCRDNILVSASVIGNAVDGHDMLEILYELMGHNNTLEMQFYAAKVVTYLFRASAIYSHSHRILYRTLHTLTMLCKKDKPRLLRAGAAEDLSYLTELDVTLQQTASICDHLVFSLADMLKNSASHRKNNHEHQNGKHTNGYGDMAMEISEPCVTIGAASFETEELEQAEIRQSALKAFASLGANDEAIRKKIIETDGLMTEIVCSLKDPYVKVVLAALKCLHSLSRSVQTMRTAFKDHLVWTNLRPLLNHPDEEVLILVSSTLCNLLLEFSPAKEDIVDPNSVQILCNLTRRENISLRLNGVWALMNMAFHSEPDFKTQILSTLGIDQIFHLLTDTNVNILMKTLGLLRNLICTQPQTDHIMAMHGKQIMQAIILILEGDNTCDVKEQALCLLMNIAQGDSSKEFIMSNEDILKKLSSYLLNHNVNLQVAACSCINNLIYTNPSDSQASLIAAAARKDKLDHLSFPKILQQLSNTRHSNLFNCVKAAQHAFSQLK